MLMREILAQAAERFPTREAIVEGNSRLSYAQFYENSLKFANWLASLGVRPGDRVCIGMKNSTAHVTTFMACQIIGAVAVPFNIRMKPAGISYIIADSQAKIVVLDETVDLLDTQKHCSELDEITWIDAAAATPRGNASPFEAFLTQPKLDILPEMGESALSQIIYTSGTTGAPKGVAISQRATYQRLITYIISVGPTFDSGTKTLGAPPLYHTVGLHWVFLQTLFVNGTYYAVTKVTAETLELMRTEGITFAIGSPTLYRQMINLADGKPVPSMRYLTYGSAAMEPELLDALHETFPNASISEFYGTTELSIPFVTPNMKSFKPGTLRTAGDFLVRIIQPGGNENDVVEPGELGELIVHMGNRGVFDTYWGPEGEKKKQAKLIGDWFRTGDGCYYDEDGNYYYHGRLDDMFICGGENIQPVEVENVLNGNPGVADCAVIGIDDPTWGSIVTAFVVRAEPTLSADALDQFCKMSDLANFKRPRKYIFVDEVPRNPSGKIVRARVRDELLTEMGSKAAAGNR